MEQIKYVTLRPLNTLPVLPEIISGNNACDYLPIAGTFAGNGVAIWRGRPCVYAYCDAFQLIPPKVVGIVVMA